MARKQRVVVDEKTFKDFKGILNLYPSKLKGRHELYERLNITPRQGGWITNCDTFEQYQARLEKERIDHQIHFQKRRDEAKASELQPIKLDTTAYDTSFNDVPRTINGVNVLHKLEVMEL